MLVLRISLIGSLLGIVAWLLPILNLLGLIVLLWECDLDGFVAVIEFVCIDCVQDQRPPVSSDGLGVADKLPLGLLGLGEEFDGQVLIGCEDVLDFGEIEFSFEFWQAGFLKEGDEGFFGEVPGIGDGLVALED